jgi:hypothetical protein
MTVYDIVEAPGKAWVHVSTNYPLRGEARAFGLQGVIWEPRFF